jgi:hypothetical protein
VTLFELFGITAWTRFERNFVRRILTLPTLGRPHETEIQVRLGLPRIIQRNENAPEFDYSSFTRRLVLKISRFVVEVSRSS